MNFVEYPFLFIFLPVLLVSYYGLFWVYRPWQSHPRGMGRLILLLFASYLFYAWWRLDFLILLLLTTLFDYLCSHAIHNSPDDVARRRWLVLSVVCNLGVLCYFKYFNFGISVLNSALESAGSPPLTFAHVLLPIGISFYTFESMSYTIDVYRREIKPAPSFIHYASFIALFPHLIAGPILRYKDIGPQLIGATHSMSQCARGALFFIIGFGKKILIADSMAPLANAVFDGDSHGLLDSWLGVYAYTMQLYFDFSGYSDMAIGLANMFGFEFPKNFDSPYRAKSITDFWRRWHMTLSSWLRDYLYIPLGGNRNGVIRTYVNLFITMCLGGIWHGANWSFGLWGAYHGVLLMIERSREKRSLFVSHWNPLNVMATFVLVMIGWAIFRAPDAWTLGQVLRGMIGLNGLSEMSSIEAFLRPSTVGALVLTPWIVALAPTSWSLAQRLGWPKACFFGAIFLLTLCRMICNSYRPFLYQQF